MSQPVHKTTITDLWINDADLHRFAVEEVGIHDDLTESEMMNAFFYLTIWCRGKLEWEHIEQMQTNGCKGSMIVYEYLITKLPPIWPEKLDNPAPPFTLPGGTDLF